MSDDLEALFGTGFMESVPKKKESIRKDELTIQTKDELRNTFIEETREILDRSRDAVLSVMDSVSMAPGEGETISAAASLLNAHAKLIDNYRKIYDTEQKHIHNKELLAMRLAVANKMNEDNNATKMVVSRDMIMQAIQARRNSSIEVES